MKLINALDYENLIITGINLNYKRKRHLENIGIMPKQEIQVLFNYHGDIIIKIKDGRLALDHLVGEYIFVDSKEENRSKLLLKSFKLYRKTLDDLNEYKYQYSVANKILKENSDGTTKQYKINLKRKVLFTNKLAKLKKEYSKQYLYCLNKDRLFVSNIDKTILKLNEKIEHVSSKMTKQKDMVKHHRLEKKMDNLKELVSLYREVKNIDLNSILKIDNEEFII